MAGVLTTAAVAQSKQAPQVKMPEPGVPQIMTMEGRYVRAAYNNEGYVILGYQVANLSVGEPWILLEVGMTVLGNTPDFKLTRDALSLSTPDGKTVPLPSNGDFQKANLAALEQRANVTRDSINYFPVAGEPGMPHRLLRRTERSGRWRGTRWRCRRGAPASAASYFPVAGGITYGQHFLNVKFQKSVVRVPFRILTKDEEKLLDKNYKDIKKQVEEASRRRRNDDDPDRRRRPVGDRVAGAAAEAARLRRRRRPRRPTRRSAAGAAGPMCTLVIQDMNFSRQTTGEEGLALLGAPQGGPARRCR